MIQLYRQPALSESAVGRILSLGVQLAADISAISTEWCYNIVVSLPLEKKEFAALQWLLGETFEPENLSETSFLKDAALQGTIILNNPFWCSADDKFLNYSLALKIGVPVLLGATAGTARQPPPRDDASNSPLTACQAPADSLPRPPGQTRR